MTFLIGDLTGENGRLVNTTGVLSAFEKIMSAHRGELQATVTTAKPLDAGQQKELRAALQGFVKQGQELQLELNVDPAILGGMIVSVGDRFVDMSTARKIRMYEATLQQPV